MNERDRDEIVKIVDLVLRLKKPNASMAMPKKWRGLVIAALKASALSSHQDK